MFGLFSNFAASGPEVHVAPADVFTVFGWPITNSVLWGWAICLVAIALLIYAARKITIRPKRGLVQYVEVVADFARDMVEGAFEDKKTAKKYTVFFVSLFFLILFLNWSGLVLGVGDSVQIGGNPLLRPMTADLNMTIGMSFVTMIIVYIASIREAGGFKKYIRHFFMGSPLNPLYLIIGFIEMITDLTRALSLGLRLFLNMAIGEIIIAVFASLGGLLAPGSILSPVTALPVTLLELGVGALQAYIFVILAVNYLGISVNSSQSHNQHLTEGEETETMEAVTPQEAKMS